MPFGHAVPFGSGRELQAKNTPLFEQDLLEETIPFVESKYRVAADSRNRAIAGLSMGGGQSLAIGLGHLDLFSAIGIFSSAHGPDFETRYAQVLGDAKGTNAKLKTFWIACGKQDTVFERSKKLSEALSAHQIRHTFRATEGAHTYTVWRQYSGEFAPLLFQ